MITLLIALQSEGFRVEKRYQGNGLKKIEPVLTPKMRGEAKIKADQDPLQLEIFGNRRIKGEDIPRPWENDRFYFPMLTKLIFFDQFQNKSLSSAIESYWRDTPRGGQS